MKAIKRYDSPQIDDKGIISLLKKLGFDAWRHHNGTARGYKMHFGRKGISDVIGQHSDGKLIAIERKRHNEIIKDEQIDYLVSAHKRGGYAGVATCAEDVVAILGGKLVLGVE